jgi:hypothetical protein
MRLLDTEDWRDLGDKKAGVVARGVPSGEGDSRAEKRLSKGCKEVGR